MSATFFCFGRLAVCCYCCRYRCYYTEKHKYKLAVFADCGQSRVDFRNRNKKQKNGEKQRELHKWGHFNPAISSFLCDWKKEKLEIGALLVYRYHRCQCHRRARAAATANDWGPENCCFNYYHASVIPQKFTGGYLKLFRSVFHYAAVTLVRSSGGGLWYLRCCTPFDDDPRLIVRTYCRRRQCRLSMSLSLTSSSSEKRKADAK